MAIISEKHQRVQIVSRVDYTADLWSIRIQPEERFTFKPGQYATLGVEEGKEIAERARLCGKEVLLHLPMEPKNYPEENPGPQAIYVDLKEGEIRRRVREALKAVPGAKGVDNHMGSRATEDPVVMQTLLDELKKQGLFFVDAQTTPNSVAYEIATRLGAPCVKSTGFFDDKNDAAAIQKTLLSLAMTAQTRHRVLAIGHCRKATLEALKAVLPKIREMGVELVPASEVLEE